MKRRDVYESYDEMPPFFDDPWWENLLGCLFLLLFLLIDVVLELGHRIILKIKRR